MVALSVDAVLFGPGTTSPTFPARPAWCASLRLPNKLGASPGGSCPNTPCCPDLTGGARKTRMGEWVVIEKQASRRLAHSTRERNGKAIGRQRGGTDGLTVPPLFVIRLSGLYLWPPPCLQEHVDDVLKTGVTSRPRYLKNCPMVRGIDERSTTTPTVEIGAARARKERVFPSSYHPPQAKTPNFLLLVLLGGNLCGRRHRRRWCYT